MFQVVKRLELPIIVERESKLPKFCTEMRDAVGAAVLRLVCIA